MYGSKNTPVSQKDAEEMAKTVLLYVFRIAFPASPLSETVFTETTNNQLDGVTRLVLEPPQWNSTTRQNPTISNPSRYFNF